MSAERSRDPVQRVAVHGSPTRCPYCHDDVRPDAATVCADCLARHHAECWSERGCCSSCSAARPLVPASASSETERRPGSGRARPVERLTARGLARERWQRLLDFEQSRRFPISTIVLLPLLVGPLLSVLGTWFYHDNVRILSSEQWTTAVVFGWGLFHALGFLVWTMSDPALEAELRADEAKRRGASEPDAGDAGADESLAEDIKPDDSTVEATRAADIKADDTGTGSRPEKGAGA